jgi:glucose-1-phosphatase
LQQLRTVIFDLGGVIVDLDVEKTMKGFAQLSGFSLQKVKDLYASQQIFRDFEKGLITETDFRQGLRNLFSSDKVTDEEIDRVWNGMLLGAPRSRLQFMQALKDRYLVVILSNTNSIHVREMYERILPRFANAASFEPFVHQVYFSHDIHLCKPDHEVFRFVLNAHNLLPQETVFLDDNLDNLAAAQDLGINVEHIAHPDRLFDLFQ